MNLAFVLRHALREARSSWRRLGLYMGAIALGVAAMVAIGSFGAAVERSVEREGKALLGGDVRLEASQPLDQGEVGAVLDSLRARGVAVARVTRLPSMVRADRSGEVRLLQVRAVEPGYPLYGTVETEPAGAWPLAADARRALVDPAVLIQLDARIGDTLSIGEARYAIAGVVEDLSGDVGIQTAIGPRVYVPAATLPATGLLGPGSLTEHQAYLRLPDPRVLRQVTGMDPDSFFRPRLVDYDTSEERVENLTEATGMLGRFLGLVGLTALLLGAVGVASAVHVFVKERQTTVAVLRCLGARQSTVFAAYLLQTSALGLAGAAAGVLLGLVVQAALPALMGGFLPVDVGFRPHLPSIAAGLAIGAWVAALFALVPLLALRDVPPLAALRTGYETGRSGGRGRWLAYAAVAATVVLLSLWQAPEAEVGWAFAGGMAGALVLLWTTAWLLARGVRRFPARASFAVRQGLSNLHRPRNQTVAVTLALGFGVFLITTTWLVQRSVLDRLALDDSVARPNLLLFDVQTDQLEGVRALADSLGVVLEQVTPLVTARVEALNGRAVGELLEERAVEPWAVRREYRNTYRDSLVDTEELVVGRWFDDDVQPAWSAGLPRVSVEEEVAANLGVGVGDRITWDVQGRSIETEVVNLRRVDWARFAPNFFVVFEPGVLERAPQTLIALARVPGAERRALLQRRLVRGHPNVSVLDLARVQEAVEGVLSRVTLAVRFLGLFTVAAGLVVLLGALSSSRYQRLREVALLRTLGARRRQVTTVLATEFAALGVLAAAAGTLLAVPLAWWLVTGWMELPFQVPLGPLLAVWAGTAALTTAVGFSNGRGAGRRAPMALLRETDEA